MPFNCFDSTVFDFILNCIFFFNFKFVFFFPDYVNLFKDSSGCAYEYNIIYVSNMFGSEECRLAIVLFYIIIFYFFVNRKLQIITRKKQISTTIGRKDNF